MYLNNEIACFLHHEYIDYIGYAHIEDYEKELMKQGGNIVKGYKYGISIGIVLPDSIVNHLPDRFNPNVAYQYKSHCYDLMNYRLNLVASKLSSFLNQKGYRSLPIVAAERTNYDEAIPTLSHKTIAHIAGIGWIGKSCLLITPEHGPRIRFTTVLTEAPVKAVNNPVEQRCGNCMECVKICPVQAIKGVNFDMGKSREERFDFKKCQEYFEEIGLKSKWNVCGLCLYTCPYGK
jgi:epoxyqueuosine reductase